VEEGEERGGLGKEGKEYIIEKRAIKEVLTRTTRFSDFAGSLCKVLLDCAPAPVRVAWVSLSPSSDGFNLNITKCT